MAPTVPLPLLDHTGEGELEPVLQLLFEAAVVGLAAAAVGVGERLPAQGLPVALRLGGAVALGLKGVGVIEARALGLAEPLPRPALALTAAVLLGLPAVGVEEGACVSVPLALPLPPSRAVPLTVGVAAPDAVAMEEAVEMAL